ncbi:hypothetical protein HYH02_010253 [Chlamydomonas schloesseri]|uniref:Uncharacterized protein n=1 Tax=Chlamydomonas schloesseri TaxID=2026947 RepID=A0A835THW8_9CHLO|nr:hypothetical protein HYH02_010253 [Chlamydomonas schloesseri]|eukprot:KAG2440674.1 hypothetical protein HYH02_010253 [Chlamydomonas schloesseri]
MVKKQGEAAQVALEECPVSFQQPLADLTSACERVATAGESSFKLLEQWDPKYGEKLEELLLEKERRDFAAQYREFVEDFEVLVFDRVRDLAKYQEAAAALGMHQPRSAKDVLHLIHTLRCPEKPGSAAASQRAVERAAKERAAKEQVKEAWYEAVELEGLTRAEYESVCRFKGSTNRAFHRGEDTSPAIALKLLAKNGVPLHYASSKEALVKMLELLARTAAGAC